MDSSDESVPNSGELDVESDMNANAAIKKLETEDANGGINKNLEKMDRLVLDLTAERDWMKRVSDNWRQAGFTVGQYAEFLSLANKQMEAASAIFPGNLIQFLKSVESGRAEARGQ